MEKLQEVCAEPRSPGSGKVETKEERQEGGREGRKAARKGGRSL